MRNILRHIFMACALVMVAAPLMAQTGQQQGLTERQNRSHEGPVQRLLTHRAELGLTASQVTQLEAIDRQMEETNRPLVQQLMQIRRELPRQRNLSREQRFTYRTQLRAAESLLKKIEENNMLCMKQVGEILTDAQKSQVRVLLERARTNADADHRRSNAGRN